MDLNKKGRVSDASLHDEYASADQVESVVQVAGRAHGGGACDIHGAAIKGPKADHNILAAKQEATWVSILYHSITAMVGAGVLGLPYALSYLGWIAGIIIFSAAFLASWYTYKVLCQMHEKPDLDAPGGVRRFHRYQELTQYMLGTRTGTWALLPFQLAVLVGTPCVYVITGADNLVSFITLVTGAPLAHGSIICMSIFIACQLVLAQIPSFHDLSWVSAMGAVMSFGYCGIALVLSAYQAATVGISEVSYALPPPETQGMSAPQAAFIFGIFNAITTFLFAYGGHNIALEIQSTLPHPPSTIKPMLKGVHVTFFFTFLCYFGVAICGYAAFGNTVAGNILDSITVGPMWLRALSHMMVVLHVLAAYQVYSYPVYDMMLSSLAKNMGRKVPRGLDAAVRSAYVLGTFAVGIFIPFFSTLMGLVGAIGITPTTFVLPCVLWIMWDKPARWGFQWTSNMLCAVACTIVGVLGLLGACYSIADSYATFSFTANFQ